MEPFSVLGTLPEAMTILGGLVTILILLIILRNIHKQVSRIEQLKATADTSEATEAITVEKEEENNG